MVKRVVTSIITLAVLMGVLVACGGTTVVVAPTPELEPTNDDEENCVSNKDKRIEEIFYLQVDLVSEFFQQVRSAYANNISPEDQLEPLNEFIGESISEIIEVGEFLTSEEKVLCDRGTFVLIKDQLVSTVAWFDSLYSERTSKLELLLDGTENFADSTCALSNKLNFDVPASIQSLSDIC